MTALHMPMKMLNWARAAAALAAFVPTPMVSLSTPAPKQTLHSSAATNLPGMFSGRKELHFDWSSDGRQLVWPRLVESRMQLELIDVANDKALRLLPIAGFASMPALSPDGKQIASVSESTGQRGNFRVISADGSDDRSLTETEKLVRARLIEHPTRDGLRILTYLYQPAGFLAAKRPSVIWLHGDGVAGATLERFDQGIQYFLANGFVVLLPSCRISRGFDSRVATAASGQEIADDVASAADYLCIVEGVDLKRVVVWGASFGGVVVLLAITRHPGSFAAAVESNGPSDLAAVSRDAPMHRPTLTALFGGSLEERATRYQDESPLGPAFSPPLEQLEHTLGFFQSSL